MSKKNLVLCDLFNYCDESNNFAFDNDLVKKFCNLHGFGNPFDVTKIDNMSKLPHLLKDNDYFIVHLGQGKHKFVRGISVGYHKFEEIQDSFEWNYRKSILNEYDTSESNILSVGINQRIIHDFLYEDIVANPKVYFSKRTKTSIEYYIVSQKIITTNLQMEIDMTVEKDGKITVFEGKNNFPNDFAVYQLFAPYLYYKKLEIENELDISEVSCCYLLRGVIDDNTVIRIYKYTFENNNMNSIQLLKSKEYKLIQR